MAGAAANLGNPDQHAVFEHLLGQGIDTRASKARVATPNPARQYNRPTVVQQPMK